MHTETLKKSGGISISDTYHEVRKHPEDICKPLESKDYVVRPIADVNPPKWYLVYVTWFFEALVLKPYLKNYEEFDSQYGFLFNSYYESVGILWVRPHRGDLSRSTVNEVYEYRKYVDDAMDSLMSQGLPHNVLNIIITGLNHEQLHQEFLLTDIGYILGNNPIYPQYEIKYKESVFNNSTGYTIIMKGLYEIVYRGNGFFSDNEPNLHPVYVGDCELSNAPVINGEFAEFKKAGGYRNFNLWHVDRWGWINNEHIECSLYWHKIDGKWFEYKLDGLKLLDENVPVRHASYFEAFAYAQWRELRLPTEFEWKTGADKLPWSSRWEWTESSYLPYPGFKKTPGALGEYNRKFVVSQKVLRGAPVPAPEGHSKKIYRNFFYSNGRWQYTVICLAK